MPFETISSEIIYPGKAFTIRRDHLRLPDGRTTKFDIVEHHGSVVLIPIDENGNMIFVRQYRHATEMELLELPAGTLDEGETPECCARREIREETGMAADTLDPSGGFYLAPGYSTEYMYVYVATHLRHDPLQADADEFLQTETIPINQVFNMIRDGKMLDAKSLAAIQLAETTIRKHA